MTYSIVARDPETGEMGVAIQTAWLGVGVMCPWAEAGVGAVATQAAIRASHGSSGLMLMRNGHTAKEALAALLAGDPEREMRQIGLIDVNGVVDASTGTRCIRMAGHRVGENYAVQANMMLNDTVPDAMAEAFESTSGELIVRMLAALYAAQAEKGDFRGMQSAALKIVEQKLPKNDLSGFLYNVRVDDHPTPLDELARICTRHRANKRIWSAYDRMAEGDFDGAMILHDKGLALDPDHLQPSFSFAVSMAVAHNQPDRAKGILRDLFRRDEMWLLYFDRLAEANLNGHPAERWAAIRELATR